MRIVVALLSLSLIACPPKKPTEQPGDPGVVAAGDTAAAVLAARDPITECPGEPPWMAWAPCKSNSAVYVVGKSPGATKMAQHSAMNRARAELVRLGIGDKSEDGRVTLRGSETLDSFVCKEETFALARLASEGLTVEATNCEGVVLHAEDDPEAACPAWTRRGAWRQDDAVYGVGFVAGITNRALASKTARNRAMAEAQKFAAVALKVTETSVSTSSVAARAIGIPTDVEMAECDGVSYTKLELEIPQGMMPVPSGAAKGGTDDGESPVTP